MLCTFCVQEGGFEGPENGPKQRRINNRLLSYRPQHRGGTTHNSLIVRWFSVFRNCAESAQSALRYKTATSPVHLLIADHPPREPCLYLPELLPVRFATVRYQRGQRLATARSCSNDSQSLK